MTASMHEFICDDCGVTVISFHRPVPPRCAGCATLATFDDPLVRDDLRRVFQERHIIGEGAERERLARTYFDRTAPARPCDRCGNSYTGPFAYCCLECAESSA